MLGMQGVHPGLLGSTSCPWGRVLCWPQWGHEAWVAGRLCLPRLCVCPGSSLTLRDRAPVIVSVGKWRHAARLVGSSPSRHAHLCGWRASKQKKSAPPSHPILPQALLTPRLTCDGDEGAVEQLEEADAHAVPLAQDVLHGVVVLRQAGRCWSGRVW